MTRRDFYVLRGAVSADDATVPGGSAVGELPVVELSFDENVRAEGGGTVFDVTAEYLLDFGELPVRGEDFAALSVGTGAGSLQRVTGPEKGAGTPLWRFDT